MVKREYGFPIRRSVYMSRCLPAEPAVRACPCTLFLILLFRYIYIHIPLLCTNAQPVLVFISRSTSTLRYIPVYIHLFIYTRIYMDCPIGTGLHKYIWTKIYVGKCNSVFVHFCSLFWQPVTTGRALYACMFRYKCI